MKVLAEEVVRKSSAELNSKLTHKTRQIKEYVDSQILGGTAVGQNNISVLTDMSGSFQDIGRPVIAQALMGGLPPMPDDYKGRALKKALQTEVGHAILANRI